MLARHRPIISVALSIAALMLASCSTATAPSAGSEKVADKAKPYGSMVIASGGMSEGHIDPFLARQGTFRSVGTAVFDTLTWRTPDAELIGGLAERWDIAPDGKTITLYIRKAIKFHDGSDLTGADVKFSLERMMNPAGISDFETNLWRSSIDKIELRDDYTVVLRLKVPQFELRGLDFQMGAVLPKKYIEAKGEDYFRKNPIGSGPWKVTGFQLGASVELEAVESHWRAVPKFEKIRLVNVKEEASVVAQLKTGELDIALVSPDSAPALQAGGIRIISFDEGARYYFVPYYDTEHPEKFAFGDVRVRKALQWSINVKELVDKMFRGYGRPYAMVGLSDTAFFYDPNQMKIEPHDLEGAKRLLAQAGYPDGFNARWYDTGGGSILSSVNQAVAGYWRKIGVNAEMVPMEQAAFLRLLTSAQRPQTWNGVWSLGIYTYPDFQHIPLFYHSTKSTQKMANVPRLDELIDLVPATADPAKKKQLALEAAILAKNSYAYLPIVEVNTVLGVSAKVGALTLKRPISGDICGYDFETIIHAR